MRVSKGKTVKRPRGSGCCSCEGMAHRRKYPRCVCGGLPQQEQVKITLPSGGQWWWT